MKAIEIYCNFIKKNLDNPSFAKKLINLGIGVAEKYVSYFGDRKVLASHRYLNKICMKYMRELYISGEVCLGKYIYQQRFSMLWGFSRFYEAYKFHVYFFIEDKLLTRLKRREFQILSAVFIRLL